MKIFRQLIKEHGLNFSSYNSIITSSSFSALQQNVQKFSTSNNKIAVLLELISQIWNGHKRFIVENCKEQCQEAPPFCNTWDISIERTSTGEVQIDSSNDSKAQVHNMFVHADFTIKRSALIYKEVLMLPLDNFVGQLGGIIGLYIGWSFLSVAVIFFKKLPVFLRSSEYKWKLKNDHHQRDLV